MVIEIYDMDMITSTKYLKMEKILIHCMIVRCVSLLSLNKLMFDSLTKGLTFVKMILI